MTDPGKKNRRKEQRQHRAVKQPATASGMDTDDERTHGTKPEHGGMPGTGRANFGQAPEWAESVVLRQASRELPR